MISLLLPLLLQAAAPFADAPPVAAPLSQTATEDALPPNSTVLSAPPAGFELPGCSRATGGPVDGGWDPTDADIAAMELTLSDTLLGLAPQQGYTLGSESPDPLSYRPGDGRWQREMIGITRGGRRILYGNYLPIRATADAMRMPTNVCDGGPVFFAAEYDMETGRITHLAFNGALGGPFWPVYAPTAAQP